MSEQGTWRCEVCGYVHRGAAPPSECPVCGAPQGDFEAFTEAAPVAAPSAVGRWECMVCQYVYVGDGPPEACPACAASADCFEPGSEPEAADAVPSGEAAKVVIVGAGIAGLSAAEAVHDASASAEIVLVSREEVLPYYRLNLTRYLAGEVGDVDLPIHPEAWYAERSIRLARGFEAESIDLANRRVALSGGGEEAFDTLILTAGAHPFVPPVAGAYREGVVTLRTADDARRILEVAKGGAKCVCLGGGILGMETAGALVRRGAAVTLVEGAPWLMPRQLNERAAGILRAHTEGLGIATYTGAQVAELYGDERVRGMRLGDGTAIEADLVVVTAGVRANSHLARSAGLEVNLGVVVDNHLRTSHPNVFAAGDVAEHRGVLYGIWPASQYQGAIAGMNAAGVSTEFGGIPRSNTLKVLGLDLVSIGAVNAEDGSYTVVEDDRDGVYLRFLFRDTHLVGAIMIGDTSHAAHAKTAIEERRDCSALMRAGVTAVEVAEELAR